MLALASIWGSSFMFIKIAVGSIPPLTLAAGRVALAAAVLYAFIRLRGMRLPVQGRNWTLYFAVAFFGNSLPFTLIGWGEEHIDSGLAAILMAVMPLTTLLLAHVYVKDEPLTVNKLIGIAVGFTGVVVLVGPEVMKGLGSDALRQGAVAAGALCYAVATITARLLPEAPPAVRAAAVLIWSAVQIVPVALILDAPWLLQPSPGSLASAVYLGLFPTALATIIYFHLISTRGASFIAFNNYLVPVFGVMWGAALLGEKVSMQELGALALILGGIAISGVVSGRGPPGGPRRSR
ncbi:MAG: DMT family transporter [Proteobacteria bacterium]|nr:DMT family transporter [Pseudomonadota bacterium]